jgi:hypothetical protein
MSEAEEIAKAIQETAKLGEKGLHVAEKAGGFFAQVFKEPVEEIAGMITDKLRFIRWNRLADMADEVNDILTQKGVHETRAVPPKIALPIMEEASIEDDRNLQHLWNNLLVNAMNPFFNDEIRYGFIEMIKNITGIEIILINTLYNSVTAGEILKPLSLLYNYRFNKSEIVNDLSINDDQYSLAANNLMRMQLIAPAILKGGITFSYGAEATEPSTVYKGIDAITLTPLGIKFVEACIK